jgi:hypothetical protein
MAVRNDSVTDTPEVIGSSCRNPARPAFSTENHWFPMICEVALALKRMRAWQA